jgi:hypothetical protein
MSRASLLQENFPTRSFFFQMLIRPVDSCFLVKHRIQVPFVLFSNGWFMHPYWTQDIVCWLGFNMVFLSPVHLDKKVIKRLNLIWRHHFCGLIYNLIKIWLYITWIFVKFFLFSSLNLIPRVKFNNYTTNQELDKKKNETRCWAFLRPILSKKIIWFMKWENICKVEEETVWTVFLKDLIFFLLKFNIF